MSTAGKKFSDETRAKMRAAKLGHKPSPEAIENRRKALAFLRDRPRIPEVRKMKFQGARMAREQLPEDRNGTRVHFKILVQEDREVHGYLTMNTMPDGKSLREIFLSVGKAGSSEAMYDEWAKQVSNRLQEGATVEQVFRTHVGTQFGDRGYLAKPIDGIKQCTSVLDLVSRIILVRFGGNHG